MAWIELTSLGTRTTIFVNFDRVVALTKQPSTEWKPNPDPAARLITQGASIDGDSGPLIIDVEEKIEEVVRRMALANIQPTFEPF